MPSKALKLVLLLAMLVLASCSTERSDLVVFDNKDKSYSIGFYKNTVLMIVDDDDHIHRLGIRGIARSDGKTEKALWGFECGATGGTYSTLGEEPDYPDESIAFDRRDWRVVGGAVH